MNLFDALSGGDGAHIDASYLRHLVERDGPLVDVRVSELREQRLRDADVKVSSKPAPRALVASVRRLFQGESYTVQLLLEHSAEHPVIGHIARQEGYHTRVLGQLLRALGEDPTLRKNKPPLLLRCLLRSLMFLPTPFSTMLLFIGELTGVLLLKALRRTLEHAGLRDLLPLVDEILIDELGHLAYNHAQLSKRELRLVALAIKPMLFFAGIREPLARDWFRRARNLTWAEISAGFRRQAWVPALEQPNPA